MASPLKALKRWWWIPAFILAALTIYSFKPLPQATPSNCAAVKATVIRVDTTYGLKDIALTLAGDDAYYYINHGLDNAQALQQLEPQLLNQTVTVYYIKHWSLFNLNSKTRHIARVEAGDKVLYNEWKTD